MSLAEFRVKHIVEIIKDRRKDKLDSRIAVTGETGVGKSTVIGKVLFRFPDFNPWKHQVYKRDDVLDLLKNQERSICWDDEAIESSYARNYQNQQQQELIKTLTKYRNRLNVYFSTLPEFFTLDKHLRDKFFMHIHVVARGVAVIHRKQTELLYSKDKWDTDYNAKIEKSWALLKKRNPYFQPPYHKLTTFQAYLYFNDLTPNQRALIEEVKEKKRAESEEIEDKGGKLSFFDKVYKMLVDGKLTKDKLVVYCELEDKIYRKVNVRLNQMLRDNNMDGTVNTYLTKADEIIEEKSAMEIDSLVG